MPVDDLDTLEYRLAKRGFKQGDAYLHQCPDCGAQALRQYLVFGKTGGRDITLCTECGVSRSWRSVAGMEERQEDVGFDLRAFLA